MAIVYKSFKISAVSKLFYAVAKSSSVDIIDALTYELTARLRKKRESTAELNKFKYYDQNTNFKEKYFMSPVESNVKRPLTNIEHLSTKQIDELILKAVSDEKPRYLINIIYDCARFHKLPSPDSLMELYSVSSHFGDIKSVITLQRLCSSLNSNFHNANGKFDHYMAKAQCLKGNVDRGMNIFLSVYTDYPHLRLTIDNMLKNVIIEIVMNRSEASMVILRKNLEVFAEKSDNYFPMACFWRCCWLSEWFADQKLSEDLFDEHSSLRKMVADKISGVSVVLLRQRNEDAILRLLQTLLRHKLLDAYLTVLQLLFDYRLNANNIKGCNEIIQNCRVLGISLGPVYHERYLYRIIDIQAGQERAPLGTNKAVKKFKLKF